MPTKIVATFNVEHPTHGTTFGEGVHLRLYARIRAICTVLS